MTYQQKNSISNHVNMWRFDGFLGPPTLFTVAGFTRHEATSEYLGILHCEEKKPLAGRSRWWGGNDPRREGEETFRPSVFWGQDTIEFSKEAEVFILEEANCECWCFSWYSWLPKREREREAASEWPCYTEFLAGRVQGGYSDVSLFGCVVWYVEGSTYSTQHNINRLDFKQQSTILVGCTYILFPNMVFICFYTRILVYCPLPMATVEADFASGAPPLPESDEEKPPIPQVTRSTDGFIGSCFFFPTKKGRPFRVYGIFWREVLQVGDILI